MPAGGEGTGLRLAVAHHTEDLQARVIEGGAVGVRQGIAQLTTFVDRPRRLGCVVARDAAWKRKLPKQLLQSDQVRRDVGISLGVGPFEIRVGDHRRPAMARATDEDGVEIAGFDEAVQMRIQKVQTGGGPPVAEQARLDVLDLQWLAQQRVREQIDLTDRQVVGRPPVGVQLLELSFNQRPLDHGGGRLRLALHSSTIRDAASSRGVSTRTHSANG